MEIFSKQPSHNTRDVAIFHISQGKSGSLGGPLKFVGYGEGRKSCLVKAEAPGGNITKVKCARGAELLII